MEHFGVGEAMVMENLATTQRQVNHHPFRQLLTEQIGNKYLLEEHIQHV